MPRIQIVNGRVILVLRPRPLMLVLEPGGSVIAAEVAALLEGPLLMEGLGVEQLS